MNRKWFFLLLLTINAFLLSGCWSKRELTDLSIVSAYALDLNEEGQYVATVQIVNPGSVAGGLQGGGGQSLAPIIVYSVTGDNLSDMDARITKTLSRTPYYAHTNLIIISDELAKEKGLLPILDELERDSEFRTSTTTIIIAKDTKAQNLIRTLTDMEKLPSLQLNKTLETAEKNLGENVTRHVHDVVNDILSTGKEPVITGFTLNGDPEQGKKMESLQLAELEVFPQADGLAVFKNGKLINWIHGETARGTLWVRNEIKMTITSINWKKEKKAIAYKVMRQKTKVSATITNGIPKISISTRAEGDIAEVKVPINLTDVHVIENIEKELEKDIKNEIEKAVRHAQKDKSDIFGFGEVVHRTDPKVWKKIEKEWDNSTFAELEVDVKVDALIRRTGLRNNSLHTTLKKEGE
ncbi:Ger(x)C family spore germination protein [Domibacillus mangrovi]|uniref:Spore gernimation protein KC n=1 Tax=Domibacillus mangrovi TaxID=1714354 RepID=A0A1Q5P0H8_9BACI|nr:Ger(x)C family spore germination protein [Domibacillus mangrovi]OKL35678.1 spore gernimation protein KC [Domibacillus mangrovi]